jgi:hypothetical protein
MRYLIYGAKKLRIWIGNPAVFKTVAVYRENRYLLVFIRMEPILL